MTETTRCRGEAVGFSSSFPSSTTFSSIPQYIYIQIHSGHSFQFGENMYLVSDIFIFL